MKKYIPKLFILLAVAFIGYHSVYFRRLSTMQQTGASAFDASSFSEDLWTGPVMAAADSASDISAMLTEISREGAAALDRRSNALAIGNYRYAMVRAAGVVRSMDESVLELELPLADSSIRLIVTLEYIYGNAIRDASRGVSVQDFPNTSDLNSISEAINQLAKTRVVTDIRKTVKVGDRVDVTGAAEFHRLHPDRMPIELFPVRLQKTPL